MNKLLTIVVPVYKVEQYICKCLDSCVIYKADGTLDEDKMNQLEVIIVNDGTPDRSAEMSREYTVRYPQTFRQIDQENRGHGGAWNTGLKEATGKYLRFLDSDDWLSNPGRLMEDLSRCDSDVVFTDYNNVTGDACTLSECPAKNLDSTIASLELLCESDKNFWLMNFWHTTYKTSILQQEYPLFEERIVFDDAILTIAPLKHGHTFECFNYVVYNHFLGRPGQSSTLRVDEKCMSCYCKSYERMENFANNVLLSKGSDIPDAVKYRISWSVSIYAKLVFTSAAELPYTAARKVMDSYYDKAFRSTANIKANVALRYQWLPFPVFFVLEKVRRLKNRIFSDI